MCTKFSVYLKYWLKMGFPRENVLVIDGSNLNDEPAAEVIKAEKFLGLELEVNHTSFLFHEERGIICLRGRQTAGGPLPCCPNEKKGRSIGLEIPQEVARELCEFFADFDSYFLEMMDLDWPTWKIPCS